MVDFDRGLLYLRRQRVIKASKRAVTCIKEGNPRRCPRLTEDAAFPFCCSLTLPLKVDRSTISNMAKGKGVKVDEVWCNFYGNNLIY